MGAHAIVEAGVSIRLDLFRRLAPLSFFSASFSGALGGRITAVSGAFGALTNTFIWNVLPPCTDFAGALVLFSLLESECRRRCSCWCLRSAQACLHWIARPWTSSALRPTCRMGFGRTR
jgi:hypothetical protein